MAASNSWAYHINEAGQVAGYSTTGKALRQAFVYSNDTGMKALGTLGGPTSLANDINNQGQVVGRADCFVVGAAQTHAFLYGGGTMIDLSSLVDPASGWILLAANAINDSGQIAGFGMAPDGGVRAFLLTPK